MEATVAAATAAKTAVEGVEALAAADAAAVGTEKRGSPGPEAATRMATALLIEGLHVPAAEDVRARFGRRD